MSIVYRVDPEIGITFVVWDGMVTDQDFIAHTQRMLADPDWPAKHKMQLTDVTTVTHPELITNPTILQMAELWGTRAHDLQEVRFGVVANEGFDKSRLFETAVAKYGPTMVVFNLVKTACIWLGIDAGYAEQALNALRAEARDGSAS